MHLRTTTDYLITRVLEVFHDLNPGQLFPKTDITTGIEG